MSRITADTTAHPEGTVIEDSPECQVKSLGQIRLGERSGTYQVHEYTYKETGAAETVLVGPRGSIYTLVPAGDTGIFRACSFNTGAWLTRQGNEVLFFRIGDVLEATSAAAIYAAITR